MGCGVKYEQIKHISQLMELNLADVNCESPRGGSLPMPQTRLTSASLVPPPSFRAGSQRTCIFSEQLGITLNYTVETYAK